MVEVGFCGTGAMVEVGVCGAVLARGGDTVVVAWGERGCLPLIGLGAWRPIAVVPKST